MLMSCPPQWWYWWLLVFPASGLASPLHPRLIDVKDSSNGTVTSVFNTATDADVAQSPSPTLISSSLLLAIWLGFLLVTGAPLAVAGVRGWKLTTAASAGLSIGAGLWAALITTLPASTGTSDTLLTILILAVTLLTAIPCALLRIGRVFGLLLLGPLGGAAFGLRIVLLRTSLLISEIYFLNWVVVGVCMLVGILGMVKWRRAAICFSCASAGTFLVSLGADIILEKQNGMSQGLRFLCDRNPAHLADILDHGYHPDVKTLAIIGGSLVLTPLLAYFQSRVFTEPFDRSSEDETEEQPVNEPSEEKLTSAEKARLEDTRDPRRVVRVMESRFSV